MFNSDNILPKDSLTPKVVPKEAQASSVESSGGVLSKRAPNARKEFKNVLEGRSDSAEDALELGQEDMAIAKKKSLSKSIFDLSAEKGLGEKTKEEIPLPQPKPGEDIDPSLILSTLPSTKFKEETKFAQEVADLSSIPNPVAMKEVPIKDVPTKTEVPKDDAETKPVFSPVVRDKQSSKDSDTSQSNLGGMVAPQTPMTNQIAPVDKAVPVAPTTSVQELIDKLVAAVYTVQSTGKTETVLTLKEFGDAQITFTTVDTAPNEVNITFSKLSQSLENLMQLNRESLESKLREAGVVFHMVTFTTADTVSVPKDVTKDQSSFSRDSDQEPDGQPKKKK